MHDHPSTLMAFTGAIETTSLAIAYGGPIFAKFALYPALKEISSEKERGKLMEEAWNRFVPIDLSAHIFFTASWLVCRRTLTSRRISRETAQLVAFKDVLVAGALVTGLASIAATRMMKRELPEGFSVDACGNVKEDQPQGVKYERFLRFVGSLNRAFTAGALSLGPAIAATALKSSRRGLLSRIFR